MHTRLTDMDYLIRANTEVTTFFSELHRNYVLRMKAHIHGTHWMPVVDCYLDYGCLLNDTENYISTCREQTQKALVRLVKPVLKSIDRRTATAPEESL